MTTEYDDLVAGIRDWYARKPAAERAAAELVIWKGLLRRRDFIDWCVLQSDLGVSVDFPSVRRFVAAPQAMSGSERTILIIAADIADGDLLPSGAAELGEAHRRAVAGALSRALGIDPGAPPPGPKLSFIEAADVASARSLLAATAGPPMLARAQEGIRRLLGIIDRIAPEGDPRG